MAQLPDATYGVMETFLMDILHNEIRLTARHDEDEIADIKSAVTEMVEDILYKAFQNDAVFKIEKENLKQHVIPVGSVAENTKIFELNEFDFLFVFPHFNDSTIKVSKSIESFPAFRLLLYQGPKAMKRKLLRRHFLSKRRGEGILSAVDIRVQFEKRVRNAIRTMHTSYLRRLSTMSLSRLSGTLTLSEDVKSSKQGVALDLEWRRKDAGEVDFLKISVDLTPSIKSSDISVFNDIVAPDEYRRVAISTEHVHLIPFDFFAHWLDTYHPSVKPFVSVAGDPDRLKWGLIRENMRKRHFVQNDDQLGEKNCFYISFVQAEQTIMQNLSHDPNLSQDLNLSHDPNLSHDLNLSHNPSLSHDPNLSHDPSLSHDQSEWLKCYKLLKFFSEDHGYHLYKKAFFTEGVSFRQQKQFMKFTSYVLKTMVLRKKSFMCLNSVNDKGIAPKVLALIEDIMKLLASYIGRALEISSECVVPSLWIDIFSAMHILAPHVEDRFREWTNHVQNIEILRQFVRWNAIQDFLLEVNTDKQYLFKKHQGRLLSEVIDNHVEVRFPDKPCKKEWKKLIFDACDKSDTVWKLTFIKSIP